MIRINLLPFRAARKKENVRRQISIFFLSVFLLAVAMLYYNSILADQQADLEKSVASIQTEIKTYDKDNREIAVLKKKLATLEKKTTVIEDLTLSREEAVRLLDVMTRVVVDKRMWLTSFRASGTGINLSGTALDNKTIADFMTRLEDSPRFTSVRLKSSQQQKVKGLNLKKFDISCSLVTLAKLKKQEADKKAKLKQKKKA
ncbi:MAG: PilN domain-containing protein [Desulfobacterales bacterium]|nr:PilN domain-containing protein [Desulfobacterales bacterium]